MRLVTDGSRMLAYKAWRESQVRFLLSAGALFWFCGALMLFRRGDGVFGSGIRLLYTIFVLVLGLGGLRAERAQGTAGFTLALPARRIHLVVVRAAAGLAQVAALALVPSLVVLALSRFVNETYPVGDALRRSGLWAAAGAEAFAAGLLASVLLEPLVALGASLAATFVYAALMNAPGWLSAAIVTAALVAGAAWITERQDF